MPGLNVLSRRGFLETVGSMAGLAALPLTVGSTPAQSTGLLGAGDWSRFGYDLQNTRFNAAETLPRLMRSAGFDKVRCERWMFGIVVAVTGEKP